MLRLTRAIYMEMVAHCLARACPTRRAASWSGPTGASEATHLFVTANAAASAMVYEIDPKEMLRVDRAAQDLGADIMGVFHSHTHTDAYPSPTDVAQATRSRLALRARLAARHPAGRAQLPDPRGQPSPRSRSRCPGSRSSGLDGPG